MDYYFTGDLHLNHLNRRNTGIIDYCDRPFSSIEEMNEALIFNWNKVVNSKNTIIHNGDFIFGNQDDVDYYASKLNGNIIFIEGNHSTGINIDSLIYQYRGHKMNIVHDPRNINYNYEFNIVAHVHNAFKFKKYINKEKTKSYSYAINVGTDVWNYRPVSMYEIMSEFYQWRNMNINK